MVVIAVVGRQGESDRISELLGSVMSVAVGTVRLSTARCIGGRCGRGR